MMKGKEIFFPSYSSKSEARRVGPIRGGWQKSFIDTLGTTSTIVWESQCWNEKEVEWKHTAVSCQTQRKMLKFEQLCYWVQFDCITNVHFPTYFLVTSSMHHNHNHGGQFQPAHQPVSAINMTTSVGMTGSRQPTRPAPLQPLQHQPVVR